MNQFVEVLMTLNDGVEPRTPGSQTYRCLGGARIKIVSSAHFLVSSYSQGMWQRVGTVEWSIGV